MPRRARPRARPTTGTAADRRCSSRATRRPRPSCSAWAAARSPRPHSIRETWARALFDARRYEEAAREFRVLVDLAPDDDYARFGLGLALWRLRQFPEAAELPGHGRGDAAGPHRVRRCARARCGPRSPRARRPVSIPWAAPTRRCREQPRRAGGPGRLLDLHDALLLDLDGVVYVGADPVPHAVEALLAAAEAGVTTAYVTNNASRPPGVVAEHLQLVRAAGAGARRRDLGAGRGPRGRRRGCPRAAGCSRSAVPVSPQAVLARGLVPVRSADDAPAAVLMGYGPDVAWTDLAEASYAVGAGAVLRRHQHRPQHPDRARDRARQRHARRCGGQLPRVGSRSWPASRTRRSCDESVERVGARRPLMVGDRLDTDIEAGHRSGIPSLLVLTGVTDVDDVAGGAGRPAADLPRRRPAWSAVRQLPTWRWTLKRRAPPTVSVPCARSADERGRRPMRGSSRTERREVRIGLADDVRRALAR